MFFGLRSSPCIFVLRLRWKGQQFPGACFSHGRSQGVNTPLYHISTFSITPANVSIAEASHTVKSNVSGVEKGILPILVHDKVT